MPDTEWFVHDRFGLFIHWGLYSLPARHEWVKNREEISRRRPTRSTSTHFDPDLYDPRRLGAGGERRRHEVLRGHHQAPRGLLPVGFSAHRLQGHQHARPPRPARARWSRPSAGEGLRIGFYHSLIDWHHPDFPVDGLHPMRERPGLTARPTRGRDIRKYAEYLHGQVRELLTQFGKVDILWFDFSYSQRDWGWSQGKGRDDWQTEKLLAMVRELQPRHHRQRPAGDRRRHQDARAVPAARLGAGGRQAGRVGGLPDLQRLWGYHRDNSTGRPSTARAACSIDSGQQGRQPAAQRRPHRPRRVRPRALERLRGIGEWMKRHGRSIYGCTQPSEFTPPARLPLT